MTLPDTEEGVRAIFTGQPEIARVELLDPGVWLVIFADGVQATAYPLNEQRRAHVQGTLTESDCFGDLD